MRQIRLTNLIGHPCLKSVVVGDAPRNLDCFVSWPILRPSTIAQIRGRLAHTAIVFRLPLTGKVICRRETPALRRHLPCNLPLFLSAEGVKVAPQLFRSKSLAVLPHRCEFTFQQPHRSGGLSLQHSSAAIRLMVYAVQRTQRVVMKESVKHLTLHIPKL